MEIVLLIIAIGFLYTIKNSIDEKLTTINDHFSDLHTQLEALRKEIENKKNVPFGETKSLKEDTIVVQKPVVEIKRPIIEKALIIEKIEETEEEEFDTDEPLVKTFDNTPKPHFTKIESTKFVVKLTLQFRLVTINNTTKDKRI